MAYRIEKSEDLAELINGIRDDIKSIFPEGISSGESNISQTQKWKKNKIYPERVPKLNIESCKGATFKTITADDDIDESVKKMRMELKETYDLLINARNTLEGINFGNLKNRIRDLHLEPKDEDIDQLLEMRPYNRNLDKLTDFMKNRFNQHSGEFGDIPEVNSFVKTCVKLQRSLDNLPSQTERFEKLANRIQDATDKELDRTQLMKDSYYKRQQN